MTSGSANVTITTGDPITIALAGWSHTVSLVTWFARLTPSTGDNLTESLVIRIFGYAGNFLEGLYVSNVRKFEAITGL